MKKLYIRHASELVTCRGKAPRRGREMADIGLIEDGASFRRPHRGGGDDERAGLAAGP